MKITRTILAIGALATVCGAAEATVYFSTNFSSGYTTGNLVGQNGWTQITTNTNPIQVAGGQAVLGTSGQDAYATFSTPAAPTVGTSFYYSASVRLTAAQSSGDYFLHVTDTGGSSQFFGKVFAKSSGAGFVLGISGTSNVPTYGSTLLNFNTDYQVVVAWDTIAGTSNDPLTIFVNPNSTDRSSLTAYVVGGFSGTQIEAWQVGAINLRQGNSSAAPSVRVSSVAAGSSLADVGVVPAPGAAALIGAASLLTTRRRK